MDLTKIALSPAPFALAYERPANVLGAPTDFFVGNERLERRDRQALPHRGLRGYDNARLRLPDETKPQFQTSLQRLINTRDSNSLADYLLNGFYYLSPEEAFASAEAVVRMIPDDYLLRHLVAQRYLIAGVKAGTAERENLLERAAHHARKALAVDPSNPLETRDVLESALLGLLSMRVACLPAIEWERCGFPATPERLRPQLSTYRELLRQCMITAQTDPKR